MRRVIRQTIDIPSQDASRLIAIEGTYQNAVKHIVKASVSVAGPEINTVLVVGCTAYAAATGSTDCPFCCCIATPYLHETGVCR